MSALSRLLPVPEPPHDPRSVLLGGWIGREPAVGFRVRRAQDVEISAATCALVLSPTPAGARLMTEPSGTFAGLRLPINVAMTPDGHVYLLDPISGQVKLFDAGCCRFEPVHCFTRAFDPPRPVCGDPARPETPVARARPEATSLTDPHGLAVCGGDLFIADSGHERIVRFALDGLLPRAPLRLPRAERQKRARPWFPVALAFDGQGCLHAADAHNARIDVFDAAGRWRTALDAGAPVWALAFDCEDRLHALLAEADRLELAADAAGARWRLVESPGVPAAPRVVVFRDGAPQPIGARPAAGHRFGRPALAADFRGFLHFPGAEGGARFDGRGICLPAAAAAVPERYRRAGTYWSQPLDSGIEGCPWHRVELRGAVPRGCSVTVRTMTAEVPLSEREVADLEAVDVVAAWQTDQVAPPMTADRWDCLVTSPPGRYLWLRVELAGNGTDTPCVAAFVVEFPRVSLRRFLPAVFGTDPTGADFTDRFTAIFDTTLRSIERRIDRLPALFDPLSAPADRRGDAPDFLSWLGTWIGVTLARGWPERRRRRYLKEVARLYRHRGTPVGLWRQLLLLLGFDRALEDCRAERPQRRCLARPLNCAPAAESAPAQPPPLLLEHFRLRRWLYAGQGRLGADSVLWGKRIVGRSQLSGPEPPPHQTGNAQIGETRLITTPDPLRDPFHVAAHRLSVFVPARVRECEADRRALDQLLALETPAHVQYDVRYVEPRFRVGVQAMIGLDSVVARAPHGVPLSGRPLGQGTVLEGPRGRRSGRLAVGEARVGTTAVLT